MARILIAEDDEIVGQSLVAILEDLDYEATWCLNGRSALETLQTGAEVDLLITDVRMPQMDGCQLVEAVRADQNLSRLPIIMMSGFVGGVEVGHLIEAKEVDFMRKPVSLVELQSSIEAKLTG